MAKTTKVWKPIPPNEKDIFSEVGATKVLLAYIDSLEQTVVHLTQMHVADRTQIDEMKKKLREHEIAIARISGMRISMMTESEEKWAEIERRQDVKKAERARRREQQRAAAKIRIREANRGTHKRGNRR